MTPEENENALVQTIMMSSKAKRGWKKFADAHGLPTVAMFEKLLNPIGEEIADGNDISAAKEKINLTPDDEPENDETRQERARWTREGLSINRDPTNESERVRRAKDAKDAILERRIKERRERGDPPPKNPFRDEEQS